MDSLTSYNSQELQYQPSTKWKPIERGWVHLLSGIVKNYSISYQSSGNPLKKNKCVDLPTAIVKKHSISYQSSEDLLKNKWVHLPPTIVKNNSISHQSSGDHRDMNGFTNPLQ